MRDGVPSAGKPVSVRRASWRAGRGSSSSATSDVRARTRDRRVRKCRRDCVCVSRVSVHVACAVASATLPPQTDRPSVQRRSTIDRRGSDDVPRQTETEIAQPIDTAGLRAGGLVRLAASRILAALMLAAETAADVWIALARARTERTIGADRTRMVRRTLCRCRSGRGLGNRSWLEGRTPTILLRLRSRPSPSAGCRLQQQL